MPSIKRVVPDWLPPFTAGDPFWNTVVVVLQSTVIESSLPNFSNRNLIPEGNILLVTTNKNSLTDVILWNLSFVLVFYYLKANTQI